MWRGASSSTLSGTPRTIHRTAALSGTLTRNAQRHDAVSISQPPTNGPTALAAPVSPDHAPMARDRSSGCIVAVSRARLPGTSSAPPTPCTTRAAMSISVVGASPQSTDAVVNTHTPIVNTRRRP